jgi:hypothetical protein
MRRSLARVIVGVLATGVVTVALPISSASALNTTPCKQRTDLVKVTFDYGKRTVCFANKGVTNRSWANVTKVSSGNNKIRFVSNGRTYSLEKWRSKRNIEGPQHLTRLRIL